MSSTTQQVRERPIIFSAPMVRAILDGRKSVTRRVVKLRDPSQTYSVHDDDGWPMSADDAGDWHRDPCPLGMAGDRLWVREAFYDEIVIEEGREFRNVAYRATNAFGDGGITWKSPQFMPRWASRLSLEITSVGVERLRAIPAQDVRAEGIQTTDIDGRSEPIAKWIARFANAWDALNGKKHPWSSDPFVWVLSFKVIK